MGDGEAMSWWCGSWFCREKHVSDSDHDDYLGESLRFRDILWAEREYGGGRHDDAAHGLVSRDRIRERHRTIT